MGTHTIYSKLSKGELQGDFCNSEKLDIICNNCKLWFQIMNMLQLFRPVFLPKPSRSFLIFHPFYWSILSLFYFAFDESRDQPMIKLLFPKTSLLRRTILLHQFLCMSHFSPPLPALSPCQKSRHIFMFHTKELIQVSFCFYNVSPHLMTILFREDIHSESLRLPIQRGDANEFRFSSIFRVNYTSWVTVELYRCVIELFGSFFTIISTILSLIRGSVLLYSRSPNVGCYSIAVHLSCSSTYTLSDRHVNHFWLKI